MAHQGRQHPPPRLPCSALAALFVLLLPAASFAAPAAHRRAAVLELRSKLPAAERSALDATYLTDLVRSELLKAAPGLELMTRENVLVLLQAQGKTLEECEGECEVETARKLGADLVVSGELLRFGSAFKVSLRLHDVATGRLLSATQAGGPSPDELAAGLPAALRELAAPLGPPAAPVGGPAVPWWKQAYLRNAAMAWGGYGYEVVDVGSSGGLRAFGVELAWIGRSEFNEVVGSETHHADFQGYAVGLSPLSLGTGVYGEASWLELTYFEPYLRYLIGTLHKTSNGTGVSPDLSGVQVGTRAYLSIPLARGFGLRLGGEVSYSTVNWRSVLAPPSTATFGGPPIVLGVFAGVGYTLGAP